MTQAIRSLAQEIENRDISNEDLFERVQVLSSRSAAQGMTVDQHIVDAELFSDYDRPEEAEAVERCISDLASAEMRLIQHSVNSGFKRKDDPTPAETIAQFGSAVRLLNFAVRNAEEPNLIVPERLSQARNAIIEAKETLAPIVLPDDRNPSTDEIAMKMSAFVVRAKKGGPAAKTLRDDVLALSTEVALKANRASGFRSAALAPLDVEDARDRAIFETADAHPRLLASTANLIAGSVDRPFRNDTNHELQSAFVGLVRNLGYHTSELKMWALKSQGQDISLAKAAAQLVPADVRHTYGMPVPHGSVTKLVEEKEAFKKLAAIAAKQESEDSEALDAPKDREIAERLKTAKIKANAKKVECEESSNEPVWNESAATISADDKDAELYG